MQKCIIGMAADVAIKITSPPGKKKRRNRMFLRFFLPGGRPDACPPGPGSVNAPAAAARTGNR